MITPVHVLDRTISLVRDHVASDLPSTVIAAAFTNATVAVRVAAAWLENPGFVTAIETLRVLLAGMCIGIRVEVVGKGTKPKLSAPFGSGDWLEELAAYRAHAYAPLTIGAPNSACVATVGIGINDRVDFALAADGWAAWLPAIAGAEDWSQATIWTGAGSAVLAAAEVYKLVVAGLGENPMAATLMPVRDFKWSMPVPGGAATPRAVVMISAGAITNSALFMLIRHGMPMATELWDDDVVAADNLNRYPLLDVRDIGLTKVDSLASLALHALEIKAIPDRFDANSETSLSAFLVGADQVAPRREVAHRRAEIAVIGSTDHYLTLNSIHRAPGACSACLHRHSDGLEAIVPTVSFVSFAAGLESARLLALAPAETSWYAYTDTWLRPDIDLGRIEGMVPLNPVICSVHGSAA